MDPMHASYETMLDWQLKRDSQYILGPILNKTKGEAFDRIKIEVLKPIMIAISPVDSVLADSN